MSIDIDAARGFAVVVMVRLLYLLFRIVLLFYLFQLFYLSYRTILRYINVAQLT